MLPTGKGCHGNTRSIEHYIVHSRHSLLLLRTYIPFTTLARFLHMSFLTMVCCLPFSKAPVQRMSAIVHTQSPGQQTSEPYMRVTSQRPNLTFDLFNPFWIMLRYRNCSRVTFSLVFRQADLSFRTRSTLCLITPASPAPTCNPGQSSRFEIVPLDLRLR